MYEIGKPKKPPAIEVGGKAREMIVPEVDNPNAKYRRIQPRTSGGMPPAAARKRIGLRRAQ